MLLKLVAAVGFLAKRATTGPLMLLHFAGAGYAVAGNAAVDVLDLKIAGSAIHANVTIVDGGDERSGRTRDFDIKVIGDGIEAALRGRGSRRLFPRQIQGAS